MSEIASIRVRWDASMGCYRASIPDWPGDDVVRLADHETVVERLERAIEDALTALGPGDDEDGDSPGTLAHAILRHALSSSR
jgi:hypothetical protein